MSSQHSTVQRDILPTLQLLQPPGLVTEMRRLHTPDRSDSTTFRSGPRGWRMRIESAR
ncbi:MAG: hypothetical protein Q9214_000682 [Letrouitia sp. 1 TL-2023]